MTWVVELPEETYPANLQPNLGDSGEYSFETARAMLWLSQLAYETDPEKIDRILARWNLVRTAPLRSAAGGLTDTRGFVAFGWGATIAVFAGTDPLIPKNWLTDFSALRVDNIHSGFQNAVLSVLPQLRQALDSRPDDARPLFLTGHSMGGALAAIAAGRLSDAGVTAVYTYGMPRCGGAQFAVDYGDLHQRTYRFVHGDDIVPNVPTPELGFRHVGRLLRCRQGDSFDPAMQPEAVGSNEPLLARTLSSALLNRFGQIMDRALPEATQPGRLGQVLRFLPPTIGDHVPSQYLRALGVKL